MHSLSCSCCPLRKLPIFQPFSAEELAFMESFKVAERHVERGTTLMSEGNASSELYTVLRGQGIRYTTLENGRRQVINFLFPGDFLGLQAGITGELRHSAEASSSMVLCVFERARVWELFRDSPERAYDLTWISAVEEHFLGETIATLGQRDALQRVAWALLRMHERLSALGLLEGGTVPLPFRQHDLADALGLSLVHTNKTIRKLREAGLANWSDGRLQVRDRRLLAQLAVVDLERVEQRPLM